jgi:hypothetical protein
MRKALEKRGETKGKLYTKGSGLQKTQIIRKRLKI